MMLIDEITTEILGLPASDRAQLAHKLIESLDVRENDSAEVLWRQEIEKRCQEIEHGTVVCKPIEEVLTRIRQKLSNARSQSSRS